MTAPRDVDVDYSALAQLRYQIRRFVAFSEEAARAADVEPQQHQLLLVLKGLAPGKRPTVSVVAEQLLVHHNSAVELAQRAVARGLVERRTGEEDRREAWLHVTPHGERVLRGLSLAHRDELRSAAPELVRALQAVVGAPRSGKRARKGGLAT